MDTASLPCPSGEVSPDCGDDRPGPDPRGSESRVRSLLGRGVPLHVKILSGAALVWYFSSFFFRIRVSWGGREVFVNGYAGVYLIPLFGLYWYRRERDAYQKKRIRWIVGYTCSFG